MNDEEKEIFLDILAHLIGATSAYEMFSGNSEKAGKRDALFKTRLNDFQQSIERGRKFYTGLESTIIEKR